MRSGLFPEETGPSEEMIESAAASAFGPEPENPSLPLAEAVPVATVDVLVTVVDVRLPEVAAVESLSFLQLGAVARTDKTRETSSGLRKGETGEAAATSLGMTPHCNKPSMRAQ